MQMAGCPLWRVRRCNWETSEGLSSQMMQSPTASGGLPRLSPPLSLFSSYPLFIADFLHFSAPLRLPSLRLYFFFNLFCWSSNKKWHMFKKDVWCQLVFTHNQPTEHCRRATLLALVYLKGVLALVFVEKTPEKVNSQRPPSVGKTPEITEGDEDCSTC